MSITSHLTNMLGVVPSWQKPDQTVAAPSITAPAKGMLKIETPDPTAEDRERTAWQDKGQRLARQEDWSGVSDAMREADSARTLTSGGMAVAELLSFGARSDVVGAVEHALLHGRPERDAPLMAGIEALEDVYDEHSDDWTIALIVAQAHIDTGWAWRGEGFDAQVPAVNMDAFRAHLSRAAEILSPFDAARENAAALMAAHCNLARAGMTDPSEVAAQYSSLIDLNPLDTRHLRALGITLLPRWNGSYSLLRNEAYATAERLSSVWGHGGYTWVMLDAITRDVEACGQLDVELFTAGLQDILQKRNDQYTANLLAAYCATTMSGDFGHDQADYNRSRIHACRSWIITDFMTELHPLLWAHASSGFDNTLHVRSLERFAQTGAEEAHLVLRDLFRIELERGQNVEFGEAGPQTKAA